MSIDKITVQATISADKNKVWEYYTKPEHITKWNFADPSWHCPSATNEMHVGGQYVARMEAKDGSYGFDFAAVYTEVNPGQILPMSLEVDIQLLHFGKRVMVQK